MSVYMYSAEQADEYESVSSPNDPKSSTLLLWAVGHTSWTAAP